MEKSIKCINHTRSSGVTDEDTPPLYDYEIKSYFVLIFEDQEVTTPFDKYVPILIIHI